MEFDLLEGKHFTFKAGEMSAPELKRAHEKYGIEIHDAVFTVDYYYNTEDEDLEKYIVHAGFETENKYFCFGEYVPKGVDERGIVGYVILMLLENIERGIEWFNIAIKERVEQKHGSGAYKEYICNKFE